ncbi:MAG: 1-acyl-sn-glycerol-3-phosphate acyltransferase [Calditrichaeota bacterium]|nr:MAG: 1-acyl-sn-glycerol-3-phosphate acyltransferase [Calditrichota bacterium]
MIRTLWFMLTTVVATCVGTAIVVVIGLFKRYSRFAHRYIVQGWAKLLIRASGTRMRVEGLENIDPDRSYIVVSNHQSLMDIPILLAALPMQMTIVAKKELFRIPVFAQGMKAVGILKIDRGNRAQALETLNRAAEVIRQYGLSVLTFPEGTRTRDGRLQRFKKGPFVLAINTGMPILPVTINGSFPIMPKGSLRLNPGNVTVTIHPAVDTTGYRYEDREQLIDRIYHIIAAGLHDTVTVVS